MDDKAHETKTVPVKPDAASEAAKAVELDERQLDDVSGGLGGVHVGPNGPGG
jgi:hypothetical protein